MEGVNKQNLTPSQQATDNIVPSQFGLKRVILQLEQELIYFHQHIQGEKPPLSLTLFTILPFLFLPLSIFSSPSVKILEELSDTS